MGVTSMQGCHLTNQETPLIEIMTIHYVDFIMTTMASQITSLTIVYSTIYSDADQRKHQSSASLAFVWGIHRDRWIPRTKGQLRGKCFHLMTSSCYLQNGNPFIWNFGYQLWFYTKLLKSTCPTGSFTYPGPLGNWMFFSLAYFDLWGAENIIAVQFSHDIMAHGGLTHWDLGMPFDIVDLGQH